MRACSCHGDSSRLLLFAVFHFRSGSLRGVYFLRVRISGCRKVECILELFEVAPAFERLYNSGPTDWRAREVLQRNLDIEAEVVDGNEHVINITTLAELQEAASSKTTVRRRRVRLTDVSQADLDEMATYYAGSGLAKHGASGGESPGTAAANAYDGLSGGNHGDQAASAPGEEAGEAVHKSKLAIVSTTRPSGR